MLSMTEIDDIRRAFFEEGKKISVISRQFARDRKTVRKYINQEDFNEVPSSVEASTGKSKLDPYKERIDNWLEEDKKARKKQRHTANRIYQRLKDECPEFSCSYRTVAGYVSKRRNEIWKQESKASMPLVHKPGEAQVDFGSADFYERGNFYRGKYLNVSFPYSNAGYVQLFKGENRECLFEGLVRVFEYIGGVPHRLWFDNASTMVSWITKDRHRGETVADERRIGENRIFTDAFLKFKQHYGFTATFCNPASGNEKGNVENKVGYNRRNFLVPVPEFEDLEQYNRELLKKSTKDHDREHYRQNKIIASIHEEDRENLLSLPSVPFDCSRYETYKTDNCGKFRIKSIHTYSTAPKYAGKRVLVRITYNQIIPLDENHRAITIHERLYGQNKQESMDWMPYLTQLSRCPGALKYTGIYNMLPNAVQDYLSGLDKRDQGRVLRVLAGLAESDGFASAVKSVSEAISRDIRDLESLVTLHSYLNQGVAIESMDLEDAQLPDLPEFSFNALDYDDMLTSRRQSKC